MPAVAALAAGMLGLALVGCASTPPRPTHRTPPRVELVGQLELPAGTAIDGVPLGGLSALARDPVEETYYALADDPGEHGPPRLYRLRLAFDGPEPGAEVLSWQPLRDAGGQPYPPGIADPEGLALLPDGSLLVASEGLAADGVSPFLRRFAVDGRELDEIALPERYLPSAKRELGVRPSLGFESLTIDLDGGHLYLATEGPLVQDGPPADLGVAGLARLLVLSWPQALLCAEYAYEVEPLPGDGFRVGGLVELLAIGGGRLLALERQFAVGAGYSLRLYTIDLSGATELHRPASPAAGRSPRTVRKELLVDFTQLGIDPGNLEGLAEGPRLADGRQTIVVVEDDNFDSGPAARFFRLALPAHLSAAS
ncbi:MAG: esterase-like activity of phytase family protein, partial [Thermoanaerobaculia bacterium]